MHGGRTFPAAIPMTNSAFFQWIACMLPNTEAARTVRGNALQRAVRRILRIALFRSPALLANVRGHARLVRTLLSPEVVCLTKRHLTLPYKYLGANYLARHLSTRMRLAMLTHHYEFVRTRLHAGFLERVMAQQSTLWSSVGDENRFSIALSLPHSLHHPGRIVDQEGDLALYFTMNDVPLYVACFSIVPGIAVNLDPRDALFVGRLQGADGSFELIRQATRLLHDISPRDFLLAALQGIAGALGIEAMVGVSNAEQLSKSRSDGARNVLFDYDQFWTALHAQRTIDNLFVLPVPLPERPIETIAQKHRARTLRKRRFKERVSLEIGKEFRTRHLATDAASSGPRNVPSGDYVVE